MWTIKASTRIEASPDTVWQVLTDTQRYKEWSTMLHFLGGELTAGAKVRFRLAAPGAKPYEFEPIITALEAPKEFAWVAHTGFRGIFDGAHRFELRPLSDQACELINTERYSGILSPLMRRLPMIQGAQEGFEAMNEEIKKRAEHLALHA